MAMFFFKRSESVEGHVFSVDECNHSLAMRTDEPLLVVTENHFSDNVVLDLEFDGMHLLVL